MRKHQTKIADRTFARGSQSKETLGEKIWRRRRLPPLRDRDAYIIAQTKEEERKRRAKNVTKEGSEWGKKKKCGDLGFLESRETTRRQAID